MQSKGYKKTDQMLWVNGRHTVEAFLQVMKIAVNSRKGQKHLKKMLFIQRVPWPDHLSRTERPLKSSRQLLQEIY